LPDTVSYSSRQYDNVRCVFDDIGDTDEVKGLPREPYTQTIRSNVGTSGAKKSMCRFISPPLLTSLSNRFDKSPQTQQAAQQSSRTTSLHSHSLAPSLPPSLPPSLSSSYHVTILHPLTLKYSTHLISPLGSRPRRPPCDDRPTPREHRREEGRERGREGETQREQQLKSNSAHPGRTRNSPCSGRRKHEALSSKRNSLKTRLDRTSLYVAREE